ncbi:MAG: ribonuclease D [Alphaproteobacteria bacterium]|nr:ribonuclease D [Alphaproteobacteria bacterium]
MSLITTSAALADICQSLARADYLTVDTEFMREGTFWPRLCLLQIAGPDDAVAVDPLADNIDLTPILELLADASIVKVMHAARQDMEIFFHMTGELPRPLFDTQVAAMVCGFGDQVGYEALVAKLTGARLDKSSRFTDWSRRPLSEEQLNYALGDVTHLRPIYEALRARVEETGRLHWIEEEIALLTDPAIYRVEPVEAWRRLKPKRNEPRYLAVLQAVAAWREHEAMTRDLPRNRVVRDETLLQVAARPPTDANALERVRGLSRGFSNSRLGTGLLDAVAEGVAMSPDLAPTVAPKRELPSGIGPLTDLLKVLLKHKCEEHQVAQRLIANVSDLELIAADDNADVAALNGWRRELFGADALRLKHGQVALAATGTHVRLVSVNDAGDVDPLPASEPARSSGKRRGAGRRRKRQAALETLPAATGSEQE